MKHLCLLLAAFALLPGAARAEIPTVQAATATPSATGWRFDVTLVHPDRGWEHYADGWEVLDVDGKVLGHRTLVHPHGFNEPFTRSLGGVEIPEGTKEVFLRAHCLVDGWGTEMIRVTLGQ